MLPVDHIHTKSRTMKPFVLFLLFVPFLQAKEPPKEPWYQKMDIGPAWMNTFGDYHQGQKRVGAIKGISLDLGENWRALFDTETLRLVTVYQGGIEWGATPWSGKGIGGMGQASGSQGGIEWGATPWSGKHGSLVTLMNKDAALFSTATGCGWADAADSLDDKRSIKGFGDMPHGKFKGHYRHGRTITLAYEVNGTEVLETLSV
jgi:hypothetical protein